MNFFNMIKPKSLFSKLISSYMIIIFLTLIILGGIMSYLLERHFYGAREWEINSNAQKTASILKEHLVENNNKEVFNKTKTLSKSFDSIIEVYNEQGNKLTKSNPDSTQDENKEGDKVIIKDHEIEHILEGNSYTKKIFGPQAKRLLVAIPVTEEIEAKEKKSHNSSENTKKTIEKENDNNKEKILGFVTLNAPLKGLDDTLANIFRITLISGAVAVFFATIFAYSISRSITKPLKNINQSAKNLAKGDYQQVGVKEFTENEDELGKISKTFNLAANQIDKTIQEQKKLAIYRKNLVDNASHEFRGPLSTIQGYCELLIDDVLPRDKQKNYLNVIMQNTINLNNMLDELMELSNLESGKTKLKKEQLSPVTVAKQSYENIIPLAEEKNQEVVLEIDKDNLDEKSYFSGDPTRINQVLFNLLKNAVQFTQNEGKIIFKSYEENYNIIFEIQDNGKGIPHDKIPNIFQRFYKLDKSRNDNTKTGLGLAITYELVKMHEGEIEVDSEIEKGTTFRIKFPRS